MDQEKFNKLFTDSIPTISTVPGMENYLTMSRELLEDFKRQARDSERIDIIDYLKELANDRSGINLHGAILKLENVDKLK
jgi:hypothetical protein